MSYEFTQFVAKTYCTAEPPRIRRTKIFFGAIRQESQNGNLGKIARTFCQVLRQRSGEYRPNDQSG
jgi:hypothetical protein